MPGYEYFYSHGEANFGPPIQSEVAGGAHLTFDVMTHVGATLYAIRRPDGLHDGPKNALYFPHGLIRFGETAEDCVARLLAEQAPGELLKLRTHSLVSWVEDDHWHLCLNVLAELAEPPVALADVSEVVPIRPGAIPDDFAWWSAAKAEKLLRDLPQWLGLE
ncbi:NUDIX hydrolase [Nocardia colli]|uniref:NUDIX hydrolase n=1 Tax=Nocardia colli TaxID=2545717 RepID=UPI0035DEE1BA